MSDRESFEEAAARLGYDLSMAEHETGEYHYPETQSAWWIWQESQEKSARAQSGQGAEGAADFRAEIRTERDPCDEYVSYLTFISGGKSHPYLHIPETLDQDVLDEALRRLNTNPQPAQQGSVPEGWRELVNCVQSLVRQKSLSDSDTISVGLWKQDPDKPQFHAQFDFRVAHFNTTPQPEADGWVRCEDRLPELVGHYDAYTPTDGGRYADAYWDGERWENEMDGFPIRGVTHYCEPALPTDLTRPQPPKGDE